MIGSSRIALTLLKGSATEIDQREDFRSRPPRGEIVRQQPGGGPIYNAISVNAAFRLRSRRSEVRILSGVPFTNHQGTNRAPNRKKPCGAALEP